MKESAVNCLLNTQQNNFTIDNMNTEMEFGIGIFVKWQKKNRTEGYVKGFLSSKQNATIM